VVAQRIRTIDVDSVYHFSISPGPNILAKLMDPEKDFVADNDEKLSREQLLQRYDMFPMYPMPFELHKK